MVRIVQTVARTKPLNGPDYISHINTLLEDGYIVVMCNPYITPDGSQGNEYVLQKTVDGEGNAILPATGQINPYKPTTVLLSSVDSEEKIHDMTYKITS